MIIDLCCMKVRAITANCIFTYIRFFYVIFQLITTAITSGAFNLFQMQTQILYLNTPHGNDDPLISCSYCNDPLDLATVDKM